MKKIISILLILFSAILLFSCQGEPQFGQLLEEVSITYASGDSASHVTQNIVLPTTTSDKRVSVKWSSSNTSIISNTGVVTRPSDANTNVTLTLTLVYNGEDVESEPRILTVIKAVPQAISVEEVYDLNYSDEVIVRGVYIDHTRSDYYWISSETRGILVVADDTIFGEAELYDEVIVTGTVEEFSNANSRQINAVSVEVVEKTIDFVGNTITDFSTENLLDHVNDAVSFDGFHLVGAPKIGTAFTISNGTSNINVYIESSVPNKEALQTHLADFTIGSFVNIENAILTFYGVGVTKSAEVFISRPDQFVMPDISDEEKVNVIIDSIINQFDGNLIIDDFSLPITGAFDSIINYSENSDYVVINNGAVTVTRPAAGDLNVTINFTVTINETTLSSSFTITIKEAVNELGTLTYFFNFDNFSLPIASNGYSEAYAENPALVMISDLGDGVEVEVVVYKNRWQLTAPAGFAGDGRGARFAPRNNGSGVMDAVLAFDLTEQELLITSLVFQAGMLPDLPAPIDYAAIEVYNGTEWVVAYNFLDLIGINQYASIEVTGLNCSQVRMVISSSTVGNVNTTYVTIDNLAVYTKPAE